MLCTGLKLLLAFLTAGPVLAGDGPPTMAEMMELDVATASGIVKFKTLVDDTKPTVLHLVTDQCAITEFNLKVLSAEADKAEYAGVQFIAVLRFINGVTNSGYGEDGGTTLAEVQSYLPAGSKVVLVQDIQKPAPSASAGGGGAAAGGCADEMSNCADYSCEDITALGMADSCKKHCGACPAEEATEAPTPAPTPSYQPEACQKPPNYYYCGAFWNMYGSDGDPTTAWALKEQVITYCPGGARQTVVPIGGDTPGDTTNKDFSEARKTSVVDAVAKTLTCSEGGGGGAAAGGAAAGGDAAGGAAAGGADATGGAGDATGATTTTIPKPATLSAAPFQASLGLTAFLCAALMAALC